MEEGKKMKGKMRMFSGHVQRGTFGRLSVRLSTHFQVSRRNFPQTQPTNPLTRYDYIPHTPPR